MFISQSSISKKIKSLENELNISLFNRSSKNISLTPAGKDFLLYAKNYIIEYNKIISTMKKHNNQKKNIINIGTIPVFAQYDIIPIISSFEKAFPSIKINILEDESTNIFEMLLESKIDFAFLRDFNLCKYKFDCTPLIYDELVFITSKQNKLCVKNKICINDMKNEKFILLGPNSGLYEFCINQCREFKFNPNITHEMYKLETILGLVSENIGVSLLMKKVLSTFNVSNIKIIPISPSIELPFSLVNIKNKKLSDNEILFREFLKNEINNKILK